MSQVLTTAPQTLSEKKQQLAANYKGAHLPDVNDDLQEALRHLEGNPQWVISIVPTSNDCHFRVAQESKLGPKKLPKLGGLKLEVLESLYREVAHKYRLTLSFERKPSAKGCCEILEVTVTK